MLQACYLLNCDHMRTLARSIGTILVVGSAFIALTATTVGATDMPPAAPAPFPAPEAFSVPAPIPPAPGPIVPQPGGAGNTHGGTGNTLEGAPGGGMVDMSDSGIH